MVNKAKNIWEFIEDIKDKLSTAGKVPWSITFIKSYKIALFKAMIMDAEYKKLKKEYKELPKSERKKEKAFYEAFFLAKKTNPELKEEEFRTSFTWEKESNETLDKLPELEDRNFRVEDTSNRIGAIDQNGIKIKVNPEGDVQEYLEGDYAWQQFFDENSAARETERVNKKLPDSIHFYKDIIEKKYSWDYQSFLKWEQILFTGWYGKNSDSFVFIGENICLRCADGSLFSCTKKEWVPLGNNRFSAFSVRCIKN